jgi:hypothetical protein
MLRIADYCAGFTIWPTALPVVNRIDTAITSALFCYRASTKSGSAITRFLRFHSGRASCWRGDRYPQSSICLIDSKFRPVCGRLAGTLGLSVRLGMFLRVAHAGREEK